MSTSENSPSNSMPIGDWGPFDKMCEFVDKAFQGVPQVLDTETVAAHVSALLAKEGGSGGTTGPSSDHRTTF